jgi:peptidyl-prolyl cis-trans isomerase SurA
LAAASLFVLCLGVGCNHGRGGSDVLARVNGRKISAEEVDKYYRAKIEGSPEQPSEEQTLALKLSILRDLIDNEILMQRAEKLGLLASDSEVDAKLAEVKSPFTKEEFDAHLKERGITLDDFRRDLRRSLTIEKVLNREILSKIDITDADISTYYNQNKAEFNLIEPQIHLAQILVTFQPNPEVHNLKNDKAQNEVEAHRKAQMLMSHLESGDDFSTLAMNYSEHPETAANGGDLNFIPESELQRADRQAFDAISHLKPGQYTQPLPAFDGTSKSPYGLRILKLIAREVAGQRDLSDPRVQQSIRDELRSRREQLLKAAYYESLRNNASVQNYLADEVLKKTGTTK